MRRLLKNFSAAALGLSLLAAAPALAQPPLPPGAIQPMEMEREARAIEQGGEALTALLENLERDERALLLDARSDLKKVAVAMSAAGESTGRLRAALAHYIVALDHAGEGKPELAVAHTMASLELITPVATAYGATLSSRTAAHEGAFAARGGLRKLVPEARAALANPRIDALLKSLGSI